MSKLTERLSPFWKMALGWIIAAAVSIAHIRIIFSVQMTEANFMWMYPLLIAAPGIISMILLPGEIRHWYRWAAIIGLSFSVYAEALPLVLAIGGTYALQQAWVTERTLSLKDIITFNRRPDADAKTQTQKPAKASKAAGKAKAGA